MTRQRGSLSLVGLSAVVALCLAPGAAVADDIAWDMVSTTSHNLISHGTDAPVFTSPASGFQKFAVGVSASIPYALVDDTAGVFPADAIGIIDSSTDFDEFFGATDTVNNDNPPPGAPYHATWVFDISSAYANPRLWVDLAAMGNFETGGGDVVSDSFVWSWQVDGGPVTSVFGSSVNEDGSQTYTMADGTTRVEDDPLVVEGVTMSNAFTTFSTPITTGSQLTVMLTVTADATSESYAARNILITADPPPPGPEVVVQSVAATVASGIATAPAGVASLVLSDSTNVTLTTSGAVGDSQWSWQLSLVDPSVSGVGTLTVTDLVGASDAEVVNLSGTGLSIVVDLQSATEASGTATAVAGIASLVLTGATNMTLTTSGTVGATQWTWHVQLVDVDLPGSGTLVLTDQVGNTAVEPIALSGPRQNIPALGTGGILLFVLLLAGAGVAVLRLGGR